MVAALVRDDGGKENTEVHRSQAAVAEESTEVHRCRVTIAEERREATATSYDSVLPTGQRVEVGIGSSSVKNWAERQRHMSQRGDKDETNNLMVPFILENCKKSCSPCVQRLNSQQMHEEHAWAAWRSLVFARRAQIWTVGVKVKYRGVVMLSPPPCFNSFPFLLET